MSSMLKPGNTEQDAADDERVFHQHLQKGRPPCPSRATKADVEDLDQGN